MMMMIIVNNVNEGMVSPRTHDEEAAIMRSSELVVLGPRLVEVGGALRAADALRVHHVHLHRGMRDKPFMYTVDRPVIL